MEYGRVVTINGSVICKDSTTFDDYTWEEHVKHLGFSIEKDEVEKDIAQLKQFDIGD